MEAKFENLTIFQFQKLFPNAGACLQYLADLKWKAGYTCPKCHHTRYCQGKNKLDRQCTRCNYLESPTAGTIFHKIKFNLEKAFWIVYYVSNHKKGLSSCELSRKLGLRQKTCWLFKQKIMQAMKEDDADKLSGKVEIEEFVIGTKKGAASEKRRKRDKLVVLAIEKKGKGVSRITAKVVASTSKKELGEFLETKIEKESEIITKKWPVYESISQDYPNMVCGKTKRKSKNFELKDRFIMGLRAWIRGTHHHITLVQSYLDEYCYRFNRHLEKTGIFEEVVERMMHHEPAPYKKIIA